MDIAAELDVVLRTREALRAARQMDQALDRLDNRARRAGRGITDLQTRMRQAGTTARKSSASFRAANTSLSPTRAASQQVLALDKSSRLAAVGTLKMNAQVRLLQKNLAGLTGAATTAAAALAKIGGAQIAANVSAVNAGMRTATVGAARATTGLQGVSAAARGVGFAGIGATAGLTGIIVAGTALVKTVSIVADFEKSLDGIRAVTGATEAQMSRLTAAARSLGETTVFTATESAEGLRLFSQAGFSVEESLSAINGSLAAAAAGSLDLTSAVDITASAVRGFQLEATEAGRVADVLAVAATSANTTIGELGEAFKFIAPVAGAAGVSIETTAAALGILADAGLKGSLGGTGLRRVISGLIDPSADAATALTKMGVEVDGLATRISTQEGLIGLLDELKEGGLGVAEAFTVAGLRGGPALLTLVNNADGMRQLADETNNAAGAAQQMAEIKLDNLSGDFKLLASAATELALTLGDAVILDAFRSLTQDLTGIIRGVSAISREFDEITGTIVSAKTATTDFLGDMIDGAVRAQPALGEVQRQLGGVIDFLSDQGFFDENILGILAIQAENLRRALGTIDTLSFEMLRTELDTLTEFIAAADAGSIAFTENELANSKKRSAALDTEIQKRIALAGSFSSDQLAATLGIPGRAKSIGFATTSPIDPADAIKAEASLRGEVLNITRETQLLLADTEFERARLQLAQERATAEERVLAALEAGASAQAAGAFRSAADARGRASLRNLQSGQIDEINQQLAKDSKFLDREIEAEKLAKAKILDLNLALNAELATTRGEKLAAAIAAVDAERDARIDALEEIKRGHADLGTVIDATIAKTETAADQAVLDLMRGESAAGRLLTSLDKQLDDFAGDTLENFASASANAFTGFINGSQNAEEAFRSFAVSTVQLLAEILVKMLAIKAVDALLGNTGTGGGGGGGASFTDQLLSSGIQIGTALLLAADGGVVRPRAGGTPVLVGEAGEPEVIIPLSKANQFGFGVGGGGLNVEVNVIDQSTGQPLDIQVQPPKRGAHGIGIDVMIANAAAGDITRGGPTAKAISQRKAAPDITQRRV